MPTSRLDACLTSPVRRLRTSSPPGRRLSPNRRHRIDGSADARRLTRTTRNTRPARTSPTTPPSRREVRFDETSRTHTRFGPAQALTSGCSTNTRRVFHPHLQGVPPTPEGCATDTRRVAPQPPASLQPAPRADRRIRPCPHRCSRNTRNTPARRRPQRLSASTRSSQPHWFGTGLPGPSQDGWVEPGPGPGEESDPTGSSQDGRIELTTDSTGPGPDPTSAHDPHPAPTEPDPLFRTHRTHPAGTTPSRTDPRRSQRQRQLDRSSGVEIPADRRSVPARAFRCRTARLAPPAPHDRPECYGGRTPVPSQAPAGLPKTLTCPRTAGACSCLSGGATSARPGLID